MSDVQIDRNRQNSIADFAIMGSAIVNRQENGIADAQQSAESVDPKHFDDIRNRVFGPRLANDPDEKDWRTQTTAERVAQEANTLSFGRVSLADPNFNARKIADLVSHLEKDQIPPFVEFMKQKKGFDVKTAADGSVNISYVRDYPHYDESAPWYIKTLFLPDLIARDSADYVGRTFGGADCSITINSSRVVVESNNFQPSKLLKGEKPFQKIEVPRNPK